MKKFNLLWMTGILILFVNASFAQPKIITGVVKSAVDHNPLSGVTVTIKELNKSVVTEEDGSFKVTVTGDKAKSKSLPLWVLNLQSKTLTRTML